MEGSPEKEVVKTKSYGGQESRALSGPERALEQMEHHREAVKD